MKNIRMFLGSISKAIPVLFFSMLFLFACEKYSYDPPKADPGKIYSFQTDIQSVFTAKCIGCHAAGRTQPNLEAGSAYNSLTSGGFISTDPVNSPETSRLYLIQTTQVANKPDHRSFLSDLQKISFLEWIRQGALNN